MSRTPFVAAALSLLCLTVHAPAQVSGSQTAIAAYQKLVRAAKEMPSSGRLETAFNAIRPLREALLRVDTSRRSTLEAMSESTFSALRRDLSMLGVTVSRVEVLSVEPDLGFFRSLAQRADPVDRAFFDALRLTYPESSFPVYLQPQTDYSGCTRFGSGTLVSTYLAWSGFRVQYPAHYDEASATQLAKVAEQLTSSTCACGDAASVEQELAEFVRRTPASMLRTRAEQRLTSVRNRSGTIRFGCVSG